MGSLLAAVRVLVALAVVFGLLWYLARRMRSGRGPRRNAPVRVIGRAGLGGKASVVVVETEGRRMVLGVTEHGVAVLHDAQAPEVEEAEREPAPHPVALLPSAFAGRTQWTVPRRGAAHAAELGPRGFGSRGLWGSRQR
ncbi:MAG TPA: flagellar biosynthetic protein FliO [Gryllotalpicola sp.]